MKTLKNLTAAFLIILTASSFANEKSKSEKLLMDYTIKRYADALGHGQIKGISEIFDRNVKMTTTIHKKIVNYDKGDILLSLKYIQNVEQNCETTYTMIEKTQTQALAKVTLNYDSFSKVNYISLANTAKGWRITNISVVVN